MDLGAQDGAEGGWVGCAAQGIDTSHQANTLAVSVGGVWVVHFRGRYIYCLIFFLFHCLLFYIYDDIH